MLLMVRNTRKEAIKDTPRRVYRTTKMKVKPMKPVAEKIINYIDSKNISEYRLSQMTGISAAAINGWRNKGKEPGTDNVIKVSRALNVPYSYFTGDDLAPEIMEEDQQTDPEIEKIEEEEKKEELEELKELSYELLEEDNAKYAIAFMEFLTGKKALKLDEIIRMFMIKANGAAHGKG